MIRQRKFNPLPYVCGVQLNDTDLNSTFHTCVIRQSLCSPPKANFCQQNSLQIVLQIVYSDVVGPMKRSSIGKMRYFATILDEYSGYSLGWFVDRRSKVSEMVMDMVRQLKNTFNSEVRNLTLTERQTIERVQSDAGGEYGEAYFQKWLRHRGIVHEATTAALFDSEQPTVLSQTE